MKNRSSEELAKTLLNETNLPKYFWVDTVNTSCYVLNRVLIRPILKKPPMNYLRVESLTFLTLKFLVVNALF